MSPQRPSFEGIARRAILVAGLVATLALSACASIGSAAQQNESSPPPAQVTTDIGTTTSEAAPVTSNADVIASEPAPITSDQSATTTTESESTRAPSPQPATAPIANAVTIDMPGMSFQVSGLLRPGMAAITLVNSDDVTHMMDVGRIKQGVTIKQVTDAAGASNQNDNALLALLADSPDTVYGTPAMLGAGQSTTITAMDLPAGNYALICFLTATDGTPHFKMGMVGELTVAGEKATEKPASDGAIAITDRGVSLPDGFDGSGTFEVVNNGKAPHGFSLARLDQGTALAAYAGHVGMAMNTGKPIDGGGGVLAGGVDLLGPGQSAFLTVNLPPGHYGYLSPTDMTGPDLPAQSGEFDVH